MIAARTLAIVRIIFACAVTLAVAYAPPDAAGLYASFARRNLAPDDAGIGWLGAAVTNALYDSPLRYGALVAENVFAALLAFVLVERRARRRAPAVLAYFAVALAALCSFDSLHVGGGTATLALAAAAMLLLEYGTLGSALALGALTILWCNFEAAGVLVPVFAIVSACGRSFDEPRAPASRRAWLGAGIATLATLATPFGLAYPAHAFAALALDGASGDYALWSPADLAPHSYRLGVLLLTLVALAVGFRGRTNRDALLGTLAFVLALASGVFVAVFGIVAAPIVVTALERTSGAASSLRSRFAGLALAGVAALAIVAGLASGTRAMPLASNEPYVAIARLARAGGVHRVFCADTGWCDAARAGGLDVVADGRIANASQTVRDAQIAIVRARKSWRTKLDALGVDAAVVRDNSALATLLAESHWTRFATAGTTVIFRRSAPAS